MTPPKADGLDMPERIYASRHQEQGLYSSKKPTAYEGVEYVRADKYEELQKALYDVLKAIISPENRHAVQDTIWIDGFTPIGDFIMGYLEEDIELDDIQNGPYRCNKTRDMFAIPEGWVAVPREPTEEQWGGLARDIMMGRDLNCNKAHEMRAHLQAIGHDLPDWLDAELDGTKHLAKGDMCVLIYKAMLAAAPKMEREE